MKKDYKRLPFDSSETDKNIIVIINSINVLYNLYI